MHLTKHIRTLQADQAESLLSLKPAAVSEHACLSSSLSKHRGFRTVSSRPEDQPPPAASGNLQQENLKAGPTALVPRQCGGSLGAVITVISRRPRARAMTGAPLRRELQQHGPPGLGLCRPHRSCSPPSNPRARRSASGRLIKKWKRHPRLSRHVFPYLIAYKKKNRSRVLYRSLLPRRMREGKISELNVSTEIQEHFCELNVRGYFRVIGIKDL